MNTKTMVAMGSIAAIALLVSIAVLPLGAQQALAKHHHHISVSIKIHQSISQSNDCSEANCQNAGANVIGNSGGVNVENIH